MPIPEHTVEGIHACLCGILSDAMESGFLDHNPAWRTYKYSGKKKEKIIADEETVQKIITALDIYTHAFDKNKKAASESLQQSLEI